MFKGKKKSVCTKQSWANLKQTEYPGKSLSVGSPGIGKTRWHFTTTNRIGYESGLLTNDWMGTIPFTDLMYFSTPFASKNIYFTNHVNFYVISLITHHTCSSKMDMEKG